MEMPKINNRVQQLIDIYANRSVKKFAESIGIPQQTVNRLFNIDTRTKKYPVATTELLVSILEKYVEVDANWLLTGRGKMKSSTTPATTETEQDNSVLTQNLLDRLEVQAKLVGRLEAEVEALRKKTNDITDAGDASCVAAVG